MTITITRASASDHGVVVRLLRALHEFQGLPVRALLAGDALGRLLEQDELGSVWLLRDREEPVGVFVMTFGYDVEFGGRLAVLTDLYIVPEQRRRSLGTAAIRFAEWHCRTLGVGALELQVERGNAAAQAFYASMGFEAHDRVPMSRRLAPIGD